MSEEQRRELVTFEAPGDRVSFDPAAQKWSLTEMFQASRAPKNKAPHEWLRGAQAQELIAALIERETVGQAHSFGMETTGISRSLEAAEGTETMGAARSLGLIETREGRAGGTWAHWQIAAAYAHYLDPRFYLQWNEWAMAYRTGQQRQAAQAASDLEARIAVLEARARAGRKPRVRDEDGKLILRRVTERITEEIEVTNVPQRPLTKAIRTVLRQAGRPLAPIEVTALLQAAGVEVAHPTQVSGRLWHMATRDGDVERLGEGTYRLLDDK